MTRALVKIVLVILSFTTYTFQSMGIDLPAIWNNYLNDLLCIPVLAFFIKFFLQRFMSKKVCFKLPWQPIFLLTCFVALYFEWYLPTNNPRYTADYMDVVLYFVGFLVFSLLEPTKEQMRIQNSTSWQ